MNLNKLYVILEAGGDSARSCLEFMFNITELDDKFLLVDKDEKILKLLSEYYNIPYMIQGEFINKYNPNDYILLPTDEYTRSSLSGWNNEYTSLNKEFTFSDIHDKSKFYNILYNDEVLKEYLPNRYYDSYGTENVIIRENISSGSKSIIKTNRSNINNFDNVIVTELLNIDKEFVVDFAYNKLFGLSITPRITYYLKNGADTFIRYLPTTSNDYIKLMEITKLVLDKVGYHGIGNLQVIKSNNKYYIIELALRHSGTSYTVLNVNNYNPYKFIEFGLIYESSYTKLCSTKINTIRIK